MLETQKNHQRDKPFLHILREYLMRAEPQKVIICITQTRKLAYGYCILVLGLCNEQKHIVRGFLQYHQFYVTPAEKEWRAGAETAPAR